MPEVEDQIVEDNEVVNDETVEEIEEVEEAEVPVTNTQAQALWDLLQNPATAKSTLNTVAANLGMTLTEAKTIEGTKAIKDVIKMALGDDLAFLGDKLGALGDALENLVNDKVSKVKTELQEENQVRLAQTYSIEVDRVMKVLDKETKGEFNSLITSINKLTSEILIGNQTPEQYLRRIYNIAKSEAAEVKTTPDRTTKAKKESDKSALRGGNENPDRVKQGSSKMPTYKESIRAAMSGKKLE